LFIVLGTIARETDFFKVMKANKIQEYVGFEVFTAVAMKNAVFRDVTQCGSSKYRRFIGT
jgi:hypothetical protein